MSIERATISDREWALIYTELPLLPRVKIGNLDKCRKFIGAVLWLLRKGIEWRMLPPEYGKWNRVFKRYSRWCSHGAVNRAHACSAEQEALGRSKGGFSCKVHAICDAHGLPLNFILTGGQSAECKQAIPLLKNISTEAVLADKAYDTDEFRDWLKSNKNSHSSEIESKRRYFL